MVPTLISWIIAEMRPVCATVSFYRCDRYVILEMKISMKKNDYICNFENVLIDRVFCFFSGRRMLSKRNGLNASSAGFVYGAALR